MPKALAGGRVEIVRVLGRGGMGVVYEAVDRVSNERLAVKTLSDPSRASVRRLRREFELMRNVRHENFVRLGELLEQDDLCAFTMELIDGVSFLSWVRGPEGFDEPRLRAALAQLLTAIQVLHAEGRVHRDVKPSNVMVTESGRVVLLDFGLAADLESGEPVRPDEMGGTIHYIAPEQAAGKISSKSDLYALGVMLYQSLTGRLPFDGTPRQVLLNKQEGNVPSLRGREPIAEDLESLCLALLQVDPERRPDATRALRNLRKSSSLAPLLSRSCLISETSAPVGRERELSTLREAHEHAKRGKPALVLACGSAGMGKTRLIQSFWSEAVRDDAPALWLAGSCRKHGLIAFAGFDGALDDLSRHLCSLGSKEVHELLAGDVPLLARMFPALARVPAIARMHSDERWQANPQHLRTRGFESLRQLLKRVCRAQPLVIALDDVHWLDGDGLALLEDLLHGDDAPPILWLLGCDTSEDSGKKLRDSLLTLGVAHAHALELQSLPPADTRVLAERLLAQVDPDLLPHAADLARRSAGWPLQLVEQVHFLSLSGSPAAELPALAEIVTRSLEALPEDARQVLRVLSVSQSAISSTVLAHATGLPTRKVTHLLSSLRVAELVRWSATGESEAFHALIAEGVRSALSPEETTVLQRRLVEALMAEQRSPGLVLHLLTPEDDDLLLLSLARAETERAEARLAFHHAAALFRLILSRQGTKPDEALKLRFSLANALVHMGACEQAADEFLLAAEQGDPETRLEARRLAAENLLIAGNQVRGVEILDDLLREQGVSLPSSSARAMASLLWNRARIRMRGIGFHERRTAQLTREQTNQVDLLRAAGHGLSLVDPLRGADFNARYLLRALELGDAARVAQALGSEATYRAARNPAGVAQAERLSSEVQRIAEQQNSLYFTAWALAIAGKVAYFAGRLQEAADLLGQATTLYRRETAPVTWELNTAVAFRMFALRHLGELRELSGEFERELREAIRRGDKHAITLLRRLCSGSFLVRDDVNGALDNLNAASWTTNDGKYHLRDFYELEARCDVDLYRGELTLSPDEIAARFVAIEASILSRLHSVRPMVLWCKARLLLALCPGEHEAQATRLAEKLGHRLEREAWPIAPVWAGLILAAVADRKGAPEQAVERLRATQKLATAHALTGVELCSAGRLAALVGGEEGRLLRARCEEQLRDDGVLNPSRHLARLAPGFRTPH